MTKKGVSTLSEATTWLQALINPDSLDRRRTLQLEERAAQQAYVRNLAVQKAKSPEAPKDDSLFKMKQLAGTYKCKIANDEFPKGSEVQWIQTIKSIDYKDNDIDHQNADAILRQIEKVDSVTAKGLAEKAVQLETKDQQAGPKRDINGKFIEQILHDLEIFLTIFDCEFK